MFSPCESVCHHGKTLFGAGTNIETALSTLPGVHVFVCLWKYSWESVWEHHNRERYSHKTSQVLPYSKMGVVGSMSTEH